MSDRHFELLKRLRQAPISPDKQIPGLPDNPVPPADEKGNPPADQKGPQDKKQKMMVHFLRMGRPLMPPAVRDQDFEPEQRMPASIMGEYVPPLRGTPSGRMGGGSR